MYKNKYILGGIIAIFLPLIILVLSILADFLTSIEQPYISKHLELQLENKYNNEYDFIVESTDIGFRLFEDNVNPSMILTCDEYDEKISVEYNRIFFMYFPLNDNFEEIKNKYQTELKLQSILESMMPNAVLFPAEYAAYTGDYSFLTYIFTIIVPYDLYSQEVIDMYINTVKNETDVPELAVIKLKSGVNIDSVEYEIKDAFESYTINIPSKFNDSLQYIANIDIYEILDNKIENIFYERLC